MVLYFEACLGDIVPASSEKYRAILPFASEWPHVLTLFLRPLQPLAQALDVFIVRLVLLFVHFQQRPQDFDAMLFSITRSACSNSRTTVRYRAVFIGLQVFIFVCGLNVVLGVGEKVVWPSMTPRH